MIRLRLHLKRARRSLLIIGAVGFLCLAIAWMHGTPAGHETAGHEDMGVVVSICLAVLEAGLGLIAVVSTVRWLQRRRPGRNREIAPRIRLAPVICPEGWARAGPADLQVFRC